MKRTICIILLLWTVLSAVARERYYFSNLSLADGLSQMSVLAIHQDSREFMWFGTRNGLDRYDGYGFDHYTTSAPDGRAISDNHILALAEDLRGNLWAGTNNGLNRIDLATGLVTRFYATGEDGALSSNITSALLCDSQGRVWVGTNDGLNRFDPETGGFVKNWLNGALNGNRIYTILEHDSKIYLGTSGGGLVVYDPQTETHESYTHDPSDAGSIAHNSIRALLVDRNGNLWAGTHHNGISVRMAGQRKFRTISRADGLSNNYVRALAETAGGDIVVGTFDGINVIEPSGGKIEKYNAYNQTPGDLSHYSVFALLFDRSKTLWVGTYAGGVDYASYYGNRFWFHNPSSRLGTVTGSIGPAVEYEDRLYVATEGGGLLEYDRKTGTYRLYPLERRADDASDVTTPRLSNNVKALFLDRGRILCGTYTGRVYAFDPAAKRFSLLFDTGSEDPVYYLGRSGRGELVICGIGSAGLILVPESGAPQRVFPVAGAGDRSFSNMRCVLELNESEILFGTRNEGIYQYNRDTHELVQYKKTDGQAGGIPDNYISSIVRDRQGNIWVGTFGGGLALFDPADGTFTVYGSGEELRDNQVCDVVVYDRNTLWVSTIVGISAFDTRTRTFTRYSHENGILVTEFTPHSGRALSDGTLYFGGSNGFILFDPDNMHLNPYVPPVRLRRIAVNNEPVVPGDATGILAAEPYRQERIVLQYDQANISIEYAALNYIFPERNQYRYMLEGFDRAWNEVGNRRIAYYTNLEPGQYTFRVEGANNDGLWNQQGAEINIEILPPLWKTGWAYLLYFLAGVLALWLVLRYYTERRRMADEVRLGKAEAAAKEEYHEARNRLFTNFSHELRTPLTLVMAPLDDMAARADELPDDLASKIDLMTDNAERLLRLVNNLMDFQKSESGKLQLKTSDGDLAAFVRRMADAFHPLAVKRNIALRFDAGAESLPMVFDPNLMEKVFFNLLSNAFKNTPDGGTIDVSLRLDEESSGPVVAIDVADSGVGIPEEELEKIFAPFYQVAQNAHSASGTGLGLSLSRSIVEMHGGRMWAENVPDSGGALFRSVIPVESPETRLAQESAVSHHRAVTPHAGETPAAVQADGKRYSILIAEDSEDLRRYIAGQLSAGYDVIEARNGAEALEKTAAKLPDLVITDVMMPKMNGQELVARLRDDARTSHIPVIMLTALSTDGDRREGYESGADAYITKPFSPDLLRSRIANLLLSRGKLKELYGKKFSLESMGIEAVSVDEQFMNRLYGVLEERLTDPELNLDAIARETGMSRANFYRKIKAITGLSPAEFLRNFRLEAAARILRETDKAVSDVFVAVGFSSHAYFSNCFRSLYGVSPSEYARGQRGGE